MVEQDGRVECGQAEDSFPVQSSFRKLWRKRGSACTQTHPRSLACFVKRADVGTCTASLSSCSWFSVCVIIISPIPNLTVFFKSNLPSSSLSKNNQFCFCRLINLFLILPFLWLTYYLIKLQQQVNI